ncbi:MAG: hypothetical protein R3B09_21150 [Nannocystaceae bacterium]
MASKTAPSRSRWLARASAAGRALAAASLAAAVLVACAPGDEGEASQGRAYSDGEAQGPSRLARIHLIVQPAPDPLGTEPQLDVTARFVRFRGLDDEYVRARVGVTPLAHERLAIGQCQSADLLEAIEVGERPLSGPRELLLIDAGNLRIRVGGVQVEVPLVLLPDLLPYMSGVEYAEVLDALPTVFSIADERTSVTLELEGSGDDEVPATAVRARLPRPLGLQTQGSFDSDALVLRWRTDPETTGPLILRIASYVGSEPLGNEVVCAAADTGEYGLDLKALRELGLGAAGEGLRVSASRIAVGSFEAGEFTAGELILEIRDTLFVVP